MKETKSKKEKTKKEVEKTEKMEKSYDVKKLLKTEEWKELEDKKISKKEKKDITEELTNIYKDADGKIPDMSKIEHKKRSRAKMILIGLVIFFAFLAGLSWLGFFIFVPQKFSGQGVKLEITAPREIAGGEEISLLIKYENNENVPLGQAEIEVRYPEKFILKETKPQASNLQNNLWNLGSIPAGGKGEIEIKGQLFGEINTSETVQAALTYKPADFNSDFQKVAQAAIEIKNSFLEISVEGPEKVLVNDELVYKVKYKNTAQITFQNLKIKAFYPENFVFDSAKPESLKEDNSVWLIENLDPEKEGEIEITGSFVGDVEGSKELKMQIGFVINDRFNLQKENNFSLEVIKGETLLTLIVNGDNKDQAVNFGSPLNYSIVYKNNSQVEMEDIEIKITFETTSKDNKSLLDWESLDDESNGQVLGVQISEDVRSGTIVWTKRQIKDLASLGPNKEGMINFQIKIKDYETVSNWQFENFEIKSLAEMKIGQMGDIISESKLVQSNAIVLKLNSDLKLTAQARYFNDDEVAVGYGPVPPKVGEVTAYRIFWKLTNSLHEIENLKVSAFLPQSVNWSEKFEIEAGEIEFNKVTREIVWTLNRLPKNVQSVGINFEVTVKPSEEEAGKLLTLLEPTTATGTDKITSGVITLISDELNSDLKGDPQVEGKGIVGE